MNEEKKEKIYKVQWRNGFSDRNGINKIQTNIQLYNLDTRTRMAIGNFLFNVINGEYNFKGFGIYFNDNICESFFKKLISEVYCESLVGFRFVPYNKEYYYKEYIAPIVLQGNYADIFTLLEFLVDFSDQFDEVWYGSSKYAIKDIIIVEINEIFEKEFVGYRFVGNIITPITDEIEVSEIKNGLEVEFNGCRSHIQKALGFLSDRENPDYKNSIKESISAVESICTIIVNEPNKTLGEAIKAFEKKGLKIHPSLQKAFLALYGYASDQGGIRHSESLFESNVTFEEAKYMLVSCCAFVNYLIAEYGKINGEEK